MLVHIRPQLEGEEDTENTRAEPVVVVQILIVCANIDGIKEIDESTNFDSISNGLVLEGGT